MQLKCDKCGKSVREVGKVFRAWGSGNLHMCSNCRPQKGKFTRINGRYQTNYDTSIMDKRWSNG